MGTWDEIYDAKGNYVVPGFIDVHTHGGAGVDVNAADQQGFRKDRTFFCDTGGTDIMALIYIDGLKRADLKDYKGSGAEHQVSTERRRDTENLCRILLESIWKDRFFHQSIKVLLVQGLV